MSSCNTTSRRRQRLAAIPLSIILVLLPCSTPANYARALGQSADPGARPDQFAADAHLNFARAVVTGSGVLVQWNSRFDPDNLGFNVYRLKGGDRTRLNGEVIGGDVFLGANHVELHPDHSYSWLDRGGTQDAVYSVESVSLSGKLTMHAAVNTTGSKMSVDANSPDQSGAAAGTQDSNAGNSPAAQREFPTAMDQPEAIAGQLQDQWAVAAKAGLKIYINHDGWYRVTQQQMTAAGFTPTTDVRNLSLFGDGREVAIVTSKAIGQFGSGDYIEFYGRGIDIPTADKRVYYLFVSSGSGKRITGDLNADAVSIPVSSSTGDAASPAASGANQQNRFALLLSFMNGVSDGSEAQVENQPPASISPAPEFSPAEKTPPAAAVPPTIPTTAALAGSAQPELSIPDLSPAPLPALTTPLAKSPSPDLPAVQPAVVLKSKQRRVKRSRRTRHRRDVKPRYSHAPLTALAAAPSFDYTVLLKERYKDSNGFIPNYLVSLLNGDAENYFGRVVSTTPVTQTLTVSNPEPTAVGPARLEVALQGVAAADHAVNVSFNGTVVTTLNFSGLGHQVQAVNIPAGQLLNGANTVTFTKTSTNDLSLIDYVKLTYPHALKADNNSLRLGLRQSQFATVDGFATSNIRLIDYTDPFNVKLTHPVIAATPSGFAITVSASRVRTKSGRLLLALPDTQFEQPAAFALNLPSTLNSTNNAAQMLVIAHRSLFASAAPLISFKQSHGMSAAIVDIEDIYDEFSYGVHGPQAIRDFLAYTNTSWGFKTSYVIFLGDADLDPRNYEGVGDFDLVPTKLVDATFSETASDDWLTDFDNDGIADIPVGRIAARTPAEAALAISKIINFVPANVPQSALLVADQDDQFHSFGFVEANDAIQGQLPAAMTVQRVNRGVGGLTDAQARTDILNGLNSGKAVVSYSGHGSVDIWTGAQIFTAVDASNLGNGNKLPFVVVMDCLNGYFQDPRLESMAESFLQASGGGAVAAFASSGLTVAQGQHPMSQELYHQLYSNPQSIALGDAIKIAKGATGDIDVRRTWIFFGDPSMKIR
jgi:Peptidase family C25